MPKLMLMIFVVSVAACAAHYTVHPDAFSVDDSTAYDALLVAQSAIDQARLELQAGQLPDKAKDSLNSVIATYNLTRDAWLTYRGAIATNVPSDSYVYQLNKNLADLTTAIRALKEAR